MSTPFATALKKLNPPQLAAVNTLDGPVMVLAGPGTGKTQVLTLRIANLLAQIDTPPSSILALTFTEAAAREMQERLVNLIGQPGYFVRIHTFHGFCQSVITENPDLFASLSENALLTDLDRVRLLENIIRETDLQVLRPVGAPYFYLSAIEGAIKDLKREGVTVKSFQKITRQLAEDFSAEKDSLSNTARAAKEKEVTKSQELALLYARYQDLLLEQGKIDFEDLINEVVKKLKEDKTLLLSYQEKLSYFLVDEYQDTNSSQNQLIFTLTSFWAEKANIFVVGDPNQSIYRFQGASTENLLEFIHRFNQPTVINLDQNYRSTQTVLDASYDLINHNPPFPLLPSFKLTSHSHKTEDLVTIVACPDDLSEDDYLKNKLLALKSAGYHWSDQAILARNNRELISLSFYLQKSQIPIRVEGGQNILDNHEIKKFLNLLKLINNSVDEADDRTLFTVLNYSNWNLSSSEILRAAREASDQHRSLQSHLLTSDQHPPLTAVLNQIARWQSQDANLTFAEFFETVFQESGFSDQILSGPTPIGTLIMFQDLFHFAQQQSSSQNEYHLVNFLTDVDLLVRQNLKLPSSEPSLQLDAVTLTTAHKSKGLEWPVVFLYRFVDRSWGNKIERNLLRLPEGILEFSAVEKDPNAEDRRLFYVALTRAKEKLFLTYAKKYETESGLRETLPSLFISELPENLLEKIDYLPSQTEYQNSQAIFISPTPPINEDEKVYLDNLLQDFKLSVTALNTYLDCAYKFKLNNLYRLPRAKDAHLSFGTAIHKALEKFHQDLKASQNVPSKETLLNHFATAMDKEIFTKDEKSNRLNHGRQILSLYYDQYQAEFSPSLATEMSLGRGQYLCVFDDIYLTGNIDRLDLIDADSKAVRVVDYKTGHPQTRNEIEGKTKSATLHYKRQLVFYRLLGDLSANFPYLVQEAELDFVEPDGQKFKRERFTITPTEVEELKALIKSTMVKIRALDFSRTQNKELCLKCEFFAHCYPNGLT